MRIPTDNDMRFPDEGPVVSGFIMSENIDEVAAALNKASELVYNTPKEASGYHYKYTELSTVLDMIRKANLPNGDDYGTSPGSKILDKSKENYGYRIDLQLDKPIVWSPTSTIASGVWI